MAKQIPPVLRELEKLVNHSVHPIAQKYQYQPQSLAPQSKWKPIVLVIGNFSSGKSTLINELVGQEIQQTGQAPTDDCFTILVDESDTTGDDDTPSNASEPVVDVPGSTLVNDSGLPFSTFKQFGNRFISHFQMKKLNAPMLKDLALIDSPGMLDAVAELDRGYDYQAVIGRLAELADLVVMVFHPHRAGTIRETYDSLRTTLPQATTEDRMAFVMNRVDECKNLRDLMRCYGGLCWNLSQMTGRKDIPRIFLTYSPTIGKPSEAFLELAGERDDLIEKIKQAPKLQVSHLLGTLDSNVHKLELIVRTLNNVSKDYRHRLMGLIRFAVIACPVGAILVESILAYFIGHGDKGFLGRLFTANMSFLAFIIPVFLTAGFAAGFYYYYKRKWLPSFKKNLDENLSDYAKLSSRYDHDQWQVVKSHVNTLLEQPGQYALVNTHGISLGRLRKVLSDDIKRLYEKFLGRTPPERGSIRPDDSSDATDSTPAPTEAASV